MCIRSTHSSGHAAPAAVAVAVKGVLPTASSVQRETARWSGCPVTPSGPSPTTTQPVHEPLHAGERGSDRPGDVRRCHAPHVREPDLAKLGDDMAIPGFASPDVRQLLATFGARC